MSWDVGLANMFNANKDDRTGVLGTVEGVVKSITPLKIALSNGEILLSSEIHSIYITETLDKKEIRINDTLMLVPDLSGQAFFIVDKVKKVGG